MENYFLDFYSITWTFSLSTISSFQIVFGFYANPNADIAIDISILFVAVATVSLILLEKIHSLKKLIWVLGTVFLFFFVFHFYQNIFAFLVEPKNYMVEISFKDVAIAIAAATTLGLTFWRSTLSASREKNFSKQIENQTRAEQNQQFLDAVKIFNESNSTTEAKKGALFHLENLALSSPAHRQRVLDFLNSLNSWMREKREEIKDADFTAWKNEKNLLIDEKIVPKETQFLSAEIPKIFENIIRKHNEEYKSFSEEERKRFALDFSYFVFAEIHFVRFDFPQTITSFRNCIFLGNANFFGAKFSGGNANFFGAKFSGGNAYFSEAEFSGGDAIFHEAKFSGGRADFSEAKFSGRSVRFSRAQFSGGNANFYEAEFSGGNADFRGAHFSGGNAIFSEAKFSGGDADFFGAEFSGRRADFRGAQFSGGNANFYGAEFSGGDADFSGAQFSGGNAIFFGAKFSGGNADFFGAEFSGGDANFYEAEFSGGNASFWEAEFPNIIFAEKADFTKCPIKIKDEWEIEEFDFLSPENYKKFRDGGAIFSDEQKKYFQKKLKSAS
jgi:uncharacterized protein YjbI with pentapeptide repeats